MKSAFTKGQRTVSKSHLVLKESNPYTKVTHFTIGYFYALAYSFSYLNATVAVYMFTNSPIIASVAGLIIIHPLDTLKSSFFIAYLLLGKDSMSMDPLDLSKTKILLKNHSTYKGSYHFTKALFPLQYNWFPNNIYNLLFTPCGKMQKTTSSID